MQKALTPVTHPTRVHSPDRTIIGASYGNFDKNEKWFDVPQWISNV